MYHDVIPALLELSPRISSRFYVRVTNADCNTTMSAKLMEPLEMGDVELAHRIVLAPCTRMRCSNDGVIMANAAEYYAQRATSTTLLHL